MSCPTCDHTMHCINDETQKIYHCPRCGTLKIIHHTTPRDSDFFVPDLVKRCRKFELALTHAERGHFARWNSYGVAEAINKPEDRPK